VTLQTLSPQEIEAESFRRIDAITGQHGFPDHIWPVVRRMIHTTADFDYLATARFHPLAVSAGIEALLAGRPVFTDTRMLFAGISTGRLKRLGVETRCHVDDPRVIEEARRRGITRSAAAVDLTSPSMHHAIVAIGNAPTALLRLVEQVKEGILRPALIIGMPVGFVNAAESKEALLTVDVPYITSVGMKGGSALAASVLNALAIMALERGTQPWLKRAMD
jgi:precorrin-8X/cobalt-precorrin-8 methylmutase